MKIGWDFPSNNNGRMDGLNDSGIHHFTEAPIRSMTREVLQDSLDAAASDLKPVVVKFDAVKLPSDRLPGITELKEVFTKGEQTWAIHKEAKRFFSEGLSQLNKSEISVLAIRDYNTSGLENVHEKINGSFASLVKSVGVTFKGDTSSGSFGIGKHAPFAASSLRTMFYGTYNRQEVRALQGVSKLASYDEGNGDYTQGTGYYGVKSLLEPILDTQGYHPMFYRNGYGTDKFIIGFNGKDNWAVEVVETVISSYLVAIMEGKLEVQIIGLTINKKQMPAIVKYLMNNMPDSIAGQYYKAYVSENSVCYEKKFPTTDGELETIRLMLLPEKGLNKKVAMYRGTGMKIFEKGGFRAPIEFAGLMIVDGPKLNAVLRKMEPPTHDRWTASLYQDDESYGKSLLRRINDWLNKKARELAASQVTEKIELEGLDGILPDITKEEAPLREIDHRLLGEQIKSFSQKKVVSKSIEIKTPIKKKRNITASPKEKEKHQKPQKPRDPKEPQIERIPKSRLGHVRAFCVDDNMGIYRLIVTPQGTGELVLHLHISGEDGSKTPITIKHVEKSDSQIVLPFLENMIGPISVHDKERIVLHVQFVEKERYSLEVSV